jgi:hypothetical protein
MLLITNLEMVVHRELQTSHPLPQAEKPHYEWSVSVPPRATKPAQVLLGRHLEIIFV